jgi:hypothetical protein
MIALIDNDVLLGKIVVTENVFVCVGRLQCPVAVLCAQGHSVWGNHHPRGSVDVSGFQVSEGCDMFIDFFEDRCLLFFQEV